MANYYQGRYRPKNPSKYIGDPTNIVYRSGWELKLMGYLDKNPNVVRWGSEELIIPYISPVDNKVHRYFTDFYVEKINNEGKKETIVIEVKPSKQTKAPDAKKGLTKTGKQKKRFIQEAITWETNKAKWKAAREFCADRKWKFVIMTEKELGIK